MAFIVPVPAVAARQAFAIASAAVQRKDVRAVAESRARFFGQQVEAVKATVLAQAGFSAEASHKDNLKALEAAMATIAAMIPAQAAFAVDALSGSMQTEGMGLPLGINDSALVVVLAGVFTTIFAFYLSWTRDAPDID
eukprot:tig00001234_g7729.t1